MFSRLIFSLFFFFNDTATTEIYTLSLHDALPILGIKYHMNEVESSTVAWFTKVHSLLPTAHFSPGCSLIVSGAVLRGMPQLHQLVSSKSFSVLPRRPRSIRTAPCSLDTLCALLYNSLYLPNRT